MPPPVTPPPHSRKRRDRTLLAIAANLLATPGLGSWIAGHRVAGAGQLAVVLVGFAMFLVHFGRLMGTLWDTAANGIDATPLPAELLHQSFYVMGIAWLWSAVTSVQMFLAARKPHPSDSPDPGEPPPLAPPRLD